MNDNTIRAELSIKPWYESATVQAATINLILAILTASVSVRDGKFVPEIQVPILVAQAFAFVQTVKSRVNANSLLYTPAGLPGPNLEDLTAEQAKQNLESSVACNDQEQV